jgi:hypothetical protein
MYASVPSDDEHECLKEPKEGGYFEGIRRFERFIC